MSAMELAPFPNPVRTTLGKNADAGAVIVNIGPSHPATHGTVQIIAELDGERVLRTDVHCGYLHRGLEKECEDHTWHNLIPYVDRLNYVSALINDFAYCEGVDRLLGTEITPPCRPRQEHCRRPWVRRSGANDASARRRDHRFGQVGRA